MDASRTVPNGIGQAVQRKEDLRFLTGRGSYGDDLVLPNLAHAVLVRSPHAHARIKSIGKSAAEKAPGVIAVLTGADFIADGLKPIPHNPGVVGPPDVVVRLRMKAPIATADYPMPTDKVRFVGEAVAMVVAATIEQAKDAAELVEVQYEELAGGDAGRRCHEAWRAASLGSCAGQSLRRYRGRRRAGHGRRLQARGACRAVRHLDSARDRRADGGADVDRRISIPRAGNTRSMPAPAAASPPSACSSRTSWACSTDEVRCVCKDMGGNFGTRNFFFPEYALLPWAARRIGRPVKWTCERREAFLTDYQGRDLTVEAELALDKDGNFLALRGSNISNLGAHAAAFVSLRKGLGLMTGVYRIPAGYFRGRGVVTNTVPTTPYRSAGRPEAIYVMERLVDLAARQCGIDAVELRRRNMIPPEAQPFANPLGLTYDNGRYREAMEMVLKLADYDGFPGRKDEARQRGKRRGIGVSNYIEITSGNPRERTEITIKPDGKVELLMGTMNSGQGHETSFAQLVTEWLGVPFESIGYVAHDTARIVGGGSHSGRSMKMATIVVGKATDEIIDKGRKIAAHLLEAGIEDIEFERGNFRVAGTDRELGIFAVAEAAAAREDLPKELQGALGAVCDETIPLASFPYGTQICEVEVDPDTGYVDLVRHAAIDDVGRAVNPLILHGQTHGGIAQGVGQAMWENAYYDPKTGQMLAATFMDYTMPRADVLPSFITESERGAGAVEPPRRPLRRRRRHYARARRRDQRHRQRARRVRRAPRRDAGNARARMARHSGCAQAGGRIERRAISPPD